MQAVSLVCVCDCHECTQQRHRSPFVMVTNANQGCSIGRHWSCHWSRHWAFGRKAVPTLAKNDGKVYVSELLECILCLCDCHECIDIIRLLRVCRATDVEEPA